MEGSAAAAEVAGQRLALRPPSGPMDVSPAGRREETVAELGPLAATAKLWGFGGPTASCWGKV